MLVAKTRSSTDNTNPGDGVNPPGSNPSLNSGGGGEGIPDGDPAPGSGVEESKNEDVLTIDRSPGLNPIDSDDTKDSALNRRNLEGDLAAAESEGSGIPLADNSLILDGFPNPFADPSLSVPKTDGEKIDDDPPLVLDDDSGETDVPSVPVSKKKITSASNKDASSKGPKHPPKILRDIIRVLNGSFAYHPNTDFAVIRPANVAESSAFEGITVLESYPEPPKFEDYMHSNQLLPLFAFCHFNDINFFLKLRRHYHCCIADVVGLPEDTVDTEQAFQLFDVMEINLTLFLLVTTYCQLGYVSCMNEIKLLTDLPSRSTEDVHRINTLKAVIETQFKPSVILPLSEEALKLTTEMCRMYPGTVTGSVFPPRIDLLLENLKGNFGPASLVSANVTSSRGRSTMASNSPGHTLKQDLSTLTPILKAPGTHDASNRRVSFVSNRPQGNSHSSVP